jgi:hypothetical protein
MRVDRLPFIAVFTSDHVAFTLEPDLIARRLRRGSHIHNHLNRSEAK